MTTFVDRLQTTISNTPGTSGAFTISTAVANYITFGAGQDGQTFDVLIIDTSVPGWEIRTGATYTNSSTSLARGTLVTSSTGSAISFTSAAVVSVVLTAERLQAIINSIPGPVTDYVGYSYLGGV